MNEYKVFVGITEDERTQIVGTAEDLLALVGCAFYALHTEFGISANDLMDSAHMFIDTIIALSESGFDPERRALGDDDA